MTRLRASEQSVVAPDRRIGRSADRQRCRPRDRSGAPRRRSGRRQSVCAVSTRPRGRQGERLGHRGGAFTRAVELKPDFAYAHYYAALAYQRQRQLSKTAEHFDAFLRLAPDAPERSAVLAILRTIK